LTLRNVPGHGCVFTLTIAEEPAASVADQPTT
jgi:hypothetical protein